MAGRGWHGGGVALVTGASAGIGETLARTLAAHPHPPQLVLVARRGDRLQSLADQLPGGATVIAEDLLDPEAPARIAQIVRERHGRLDLLVNNAGAAWRGTFAEAGAANVRQTMELNLDAVCRLTEALLPILRESAPSAIVNVASTAGRVARAGVGAYSASKFALIGWTDSLHLEEAPHGVHVGMVLPGFVSTEGFPQEQLTTKPHLRWIVAKQETVAAAILDAAGGRAERYTPRIYGVAAVLRIAAPSLTRRILG